MSTRSHVCVCNLLMTSTAAIILNWLDILSAQVSSYAMCIQVSQQWMQYESLKILDHRHDEGSQEEVFDVEVDVRQVEDR